MKYSTFFALFGATILAPCGEAYAYLDPGTGSILLQGLIGTIAAGLVAGRLYWDKVRGFLFPSSRGKAPASQREGARDVK